MKGESMTPINSLDRFLEVQLQTWCRKDEKQKNKRTGPVIAISREPGCDGEFLAQTIAKKFGLVLYDQKIVEEIAKDANVSELVVTTLDENLRSELDDWLVSFTEESSLSSSQYIRSLRKVLFTVATHGNVVFLGRGANFLLPPEKRTLGLRLVAPLETRVKNTMQELSLSKESALEQITRKEHEQQMWVRKHCDANIDDATNYHIVINTALVTPESIIQIVQEILDVKS
jgi:cytidylate kinase